MPRKLLVLAASIAIVLCSAVPLTLGQSQQIKHFHRFQLKKRRVSLTAQCQRKTGRTSLPTQLETAIVSRRSGITKSSRSSGLRPTVTPS